MTQISELQATVYRRSYSKAFKAGIVSQCQATDASVARIALNHGLNVNMVHRWIREQDHSCTGHNLVPAEPGNDNNQVEIVSVLGHCVMNQWNLNTQTANC